MTAKLRIVQCGLGPIGLGVTREILTRTGYEIVGAVDVSPDLGGKSLGRTGR